MKYKPFSSRVQLYITYIFRSVYKKRGNNMTLEQIKQFKEENCSKCNKDIDCKITQDINGKLKCTEE